MLCVIKIARSGKIMGENLQRRNSMLLKKKKAPDDEVQVDDGETSCRVCHECCGQPYARIRATKRSPENWTAAQLHIDYETKKGVVSCLCNKKKEMSAHISPSKSCICIDITQFFS